VPLNEEEEYRLLYAAMVELHEKCEERKAGVKRLLLELDDLRKKAVKDLARAKSLSRRLTVYHRREMGFLRVNGGGSRSSSFPIPVNGKRAALLDSTPAPVPVLAPANRRELKSGGLKILSVIDQLKKNLLQLELLELRCRELLVSITKALEAFAYALRTVKRKVYPFSIFSRIRKTLRSFRGRPYYTPGDLEELAVLGALTVNITDMAETPVI
jgi:hypothetical protein